MGMSLYCLGADGVAADAVALAEMFATPAALALFHARRSEQLNTADHARKIVGRALGIVMERYRLDEERAFKFLACVSQDTHLKVRDLATELVTATNAANARPQRQPTRSHDSDHAT